MCVYALEAGLCFCLYLYLGLSVYTVRECGVVDKGERASSPMASIVAERGIATRLDYACMVAWTCRPDMP